MKVAGRGSNSIKFRWRTSSQGIDDVDYWLKDKKLKSLLVFISVQENLEGVAMHQSFRELGESFDTKVRHHAN